MAENKFSSLQTRVKTGIFLAILLAIVIAIGEVGIFYFICLVSLLAQWEFLSLFLGDDEKRTKSIYCALGVLYFLFLRHTPTIPLIFYVGVVGLFSALYSLRNFTQENAINNMKKACLGLISFIYVPVIFGFMSRFSLIEQAMVALIPIVSDTFAYFAGVRFGKTKIWVSVSPKKSVEGCVVGLLASVLVVMIFANFNPNLDMSFFTLLLFGVILGILAQLGDFFESALKRTVNIKDSGTLLPGHGGVLDRTDSLIFTIAGFELFLLFVNSL